MRFSVVRCDDCGEEEWVTTPIKYPEGWARRTITRTEVWDLCPSCGADPLNDPLPTSQSEMRLQVVQRLLEAHPTHSDHQIAEEAGRWGVVMSGETVRRNRHKLGFKGCRFRRKEAMW